MATTKPRNLSKIVNDTETSGGLFGWVRVNRGISLKYLLTQAASNLVILEGSYGFVKLHAWHLVKQKYILTVSSRWCKVENKRVVVFFKPDRV
jgi:hypothetical protein